MVSLREEAEMKLDKYEYTLRKMHHPVEGMGAQGYSQGEIEAAENELKNLMEFWEDRLEDA